MYVKLHYVWAKIIVKAAGTGLEQKLPTDIGEITVDVRHVHRGPISLLHVRRMPGRPHDHSGEGSSGDWRPVVRKRVGLHRVLQRNAFHQLNPVLAPSGRAGTIINTRKSGKVVLTTTL